MPPRVADGGGRAERQQPQGDERKANRDTVPTAGANCNARLPMPIQPAISSRPRAGARQRQAQQSPRGRRRSCDRLARKVGGPLQRVAGGGREALEVLGRVDVER